MAEDGTETITVISPHTEEPIATVTAPGPADVDTAVVTARAAFDHGPWPRLDAGERIAVVRRLAEIYAARGGEMAELISREIGAPISFASSAQALSGMSHFATTARLLCGFEFEEMIGKTRVVHEPIGVVGSGKGNAAPELYFELRRGGQPVNPDSWLQRR